MKVGDLVRYTKRNEAGDVYDTNPYALWLGVILSQNNGTAEYQTVLWNRRGGITSSIPARDLEVVSEGR